MQASPEFVALSPEPEVLVGSYYSGDGLGYNLRLTLDSDQTFTGSLHGCLGHYGSAEGTWSLSESTVIFANTSATDRMKDFLVEADVISHEGHAMMVLDRFRDHFESVGPSRESALHRREATQVLTGRRR